jgi:hypothetical protein
MIWVLAVKKKAFHAERLIINLNRPVDLINNIKLMYGGSFREVFLYPNRARQIPFFWLFTCCSRAVE